MAEEQKSALDEVLEAIGPNNAQSDWKIAPTEHAGTLASTAPSLAKRLRGSRLQGLAKRYEECDARALAAQKRFKGVVASADWAIFATACLGAVLLAAAGLPDLIGQSEDAKRGVSIAAAMIGVLGVISGALATMWLSRARGAEMARRWADERAKAEAMRLRFFKEVIRGAAQAVPEKLLAFEYTRRFLLDSQLDYFRNRGAEHESAADEALKQSTLASAGSSIFIGVAGLLAVASTKFGMIATLGVIAAAYSSLATSRSALSLDRRNADRYRLAAEKLSERRFDLDDYRLRVASGDGAAVEEFFEPVYITLEADHKEFLDDREQREVAIGKMEQRLDEARQALDKKPDSSPSASEPAKD